MWIGTSGCIYDVFQAGDLKMLARLVVHRVRAPGKCIVDSAAHEQHEVIQVYIRQSKQTERIKYNLLRILVYFPFFCFFF